MQIVEELPQIENIAKFHDDCIIHWQKNPIYLEQKGFLALVENNHACNYQLWHAEDKARRDDAGYKFVYLAKREIDKFNQHRNNFMEAMDQWLFDFLAPADSANCPINSETPGMIIDRLSILALKSYFMYLQTTRVDVDQKHLYNCQLKLKTLISQKQNLQNCLSSLINDVTNKKRTFIIYYQHKMYNEPSLNPELYKNKK